MPDPQSARTRRIIALALMPGALVPGGAAAVLDFILGLWFFGMGQTS